MSSIVRPGHHALLRFDKDGIARNSYLLYTPEGGPLEVTSIVVNKQRLLIGSEALGVYEFAHPSKKENLKTEKDNNNSTAEKKSSP